MPESFLQVSCVCFIPSIKELKPGCWLTICNYHSGLSQGRILNLLLQIRKQRPRKVHSHTWVCLCGDELFSSNKDQAGCSWALLVAQMVKNLPAMQQIQVQSLGWEDPLEKGMTNHSSILAWRISWTEEPGGLQSMGLQRVGQDWAINTFTFRLP